MFEKDGFADSEGDRDRCTGNQPFKDNLRKGFSEWYALEVAKQLTDGVQADAVQIDFRMSTVKGVSCKWIMSAYDHIRSSPEIVKSGFRKAGIAHAIESDTSQTDTGTLFLNSDPFDSCDSD